MQMHQLNQARPQAALWCRRWVSRVEKAALAPEQQSNFASSAGTKDEQAPGSGHGAHWALGRDLFSQV